MIQPLSFAYWLRMLAPSIVHWSHLWQISPIFQEKERILQKENILFGGDTLLLFIAQWLKLDTQIIGMMCLVLYNNQVKLACRWYWGMWSLFRRLLAAILSFTKKKHPPTVLNKRIYINGVIHAIQIILFIVSFLKVFS